jgi:glucose/arabinose dehydrogenase
MTTYRSLGLALLVLGSGALAQPPAAPNVLLPTRDKPLVLDAGRLKIRVALVADGLVAPWDIAFLPDGKSMLVTESNGALRLIENGVLRPEPVWNAPSPPGNDVRTAS